MLLAQERHALAEAGRRLAARGLVIGTGGNLSVRVGDLVAVTPTGGVLGELTTAQMTVIDLDGVVADGDLAPTSEVPLHLAIYRSTQASAIAHTHATTSTAIGLVADEIPLVHYAMLSLGGAVRVAPYACYGTEQLAGHVVKALEFKQAALMRNHGSIATGSSVAKAVDNLELLEWAAQVYHQALLASAVTGRAPRELTAQEQEEVITAALSTGYGTTKKLDGQGPQVTTLPAILRAHAALVISAYALCVSGRTCMVAACGGTAPHGPTPPGPWDICRLAGPPSAMARLRYRCCTTTSCGDVALMRATGNRLSSWSRE